MIVGFAVIRIQRDARSMPFWAGPMCAAVGDFIMVMAGFDPDDSRFNAPRWVALGPGGREFQGGLSVGGDAFAVNVGEMLGRIFFSPGALLLDFMALAAWFYLLRGLARRLRGDVAESKRRPPTRR